MARFAKLTVVIGERGSGKSNLTLDMLFAAANNGRKVLIYDVNDEYGDYEYREGQPKYNIKAIFIKDIPRFTVQTRAEVVRIRPYWDDSRRMGTEDMLKCLEMILNTYRDGVLLVEDPNRYISDSTPQAVVGKLATLRQEGVDVILQYQLIGKAGHPKIMGMLNYLRIHKCERVEKHEDKYGSLTEIIAIAQNIVDRRYKWGVRNGVNDRTGRFFSVTIDKEYKKIKGIFTKQEATDAIDKYLSRNRGRLVRQELDTLDKKGNAIFPNYAAAYAFKEKDLMEDYFIFGQ